MNRRTVQILMVFLQAFGQAALALGSGVGALAGVGAGLSESWRAVLMPVPILAAIGAFVLAIRQGFADPPPKVWDGEERRAS